MYKAKSPAIFTQNPAMIGQSLGLAKRKQPVVREITEQSTKPKEHHRFIEVLYSFHIGLL